MLSKFEKAVYIILTAFLIIAVAILVVKTIKMFILGHILHGSIITVCAVMASLFITRVISLITQGFKIFK